LHEQEGGIYGGGARGSMSNPEPGFNFSISSMWINAEKLDCVSIKKGNSRF
jgi:hypothetical protein